MTTTTHKITKKLVTGNDACGAILCFKIADPSYRTVTVTVADLGHWDVGESEDFGCPKNEDGDLIGYAVTVGGSIFALPGSAVSQYGLDQKLYRVHRTPATAVADAHVIAAEIAKGMEKDAEPVLTGNSK